MTKYDRIIKDKYKNVEAVVDVYSVLDAFKVTNPGTQHAIKKLLCAGQRLKADTLQDLEETISAIQRAIEIEKYHQQCYDKCDDDTVKLPKNKSSVFANLPSST